MLKIRSFSQVLFFSLLLFGCKSSQKTVNNSCKGKVELQQEWLESDKEDKDHLIAKRLTVGFAIHFIGNFDDDRLNVFLNNQLQKINIEGTGATDEKSYACVFAAIKPDIQILKIESAKKAQCISVKMDWKYPIVYVWLENDKWVVRYSNFYHSDNLGKRI